MSESVEHVDAHLRDYKRTIAVLAALTAVEFAVAFAMKGRLGPLHVSFTVGVLLLLALAAWKAGLVARFFMHLRYDPRLLALVALVPLLLAASIVASVAFDLIKGPTFR